MIFYFFFPCHPDFFPGGPKEFFFHFYLIRDFFLLNGRKLGLSDPSPVFGWDFFPPDFSYPLIAQLLHSFFPSFT